MQPRRVAFYVLLLSFLAILFNIIFYRLQRKFKISNSILVLPSGERKIQTRLEGKRSITRQPESNSWKINALKSKEEKYNTELVKNSDKTLLFKDCTTRNCQDLRSPAKIYVYELPSYFNTDIKRFLTDSKKFSRCFNLDFCGMGEEIYRIDDSGRQVTTLENGPQVSDAVENSDFSKGSGAFSAAQSVRNTHQFALEVIIHCKLLHSPYRTLIPEEADLFYIPAYAGLQCISERNNNSIFVNKLFDFMLTNKKTSRYFKSGKPHFMALSKIQREMAEIRCPILRHTKAMNITFIGIEKETNPSWHDQRQIFGKSVIIVPYPSYIHYVSTVNTQTFDRNHLLNTRRPFMHIPVLETRNILLFLAASTRRTNPFRAKILDQFYIKTSDSPKVFFSNCSREMPKLYVDQIMLITNECSPDHRSTTVPWMRSSIYCLQPPGDSLTRKSFFDAILSGCIPVIFKGKYKTEYPFQRVVNYDNFTYTIDHELLTIRNRTVLDIVKEISPQRTRLLHNNLRSVAKWFQYSVPQDGTQLGEDAFTMLLDELFYKHNLYVLSRSTSL